MLADRERGLLFQNDFNFITDREEVLVSLCNGALETNSYYNRGNLFSLLLQFALHRGIISSGHRMPVLVLGLGSGI
jgi:hypothetical protein